MKHIPQMSLTTNTAWIYVLKKVVSIVVVNEKDAANPTLAILTRFMGTENVRLESQLSWEPLIVSEVGVNEICKTIQIYS